MIINADLLFVLKCVWVIVATAFFVRAAWKLESK